MCGRTGATVPRWGGSRARGRARASFFVAEVAVLGLGLYEAQPLATSLRRARAAWAETSSTVADCTQVQEAFAERTGGSRSTSGGQAETIVPTFERIDRLHPFTGCGQRAIPVAGTPASSVAKSIARNGRQRGLDRAVMEGIPDRGCRPVFTDGAEQTVYGAALSEKCPTCNGGPSKRCTTGVSEVRLASGR